MNDDQKTQWLLHQSRGGVKGIFFRFASVGEALFVLLALVLVARILFRSLGFADADTFLFGEGVVPDFRAAAIAESQWHGIRYGLIIVAIYFIGRMRQRGGRTSYGLTTGARSVLSLVAFGVGAFAVMHIPSLALRLTDSIFDIGPGTPFWSLMKKVEWDVDFWIYMAVSSFFVVPIVEEIVARGYLLGRLRESFSPGGALLIMGLIFAAAHTQYHKTDLYSLGSLIALVWGSVIMGYAVYRTGSLIPAIIAHGLVNIPTSLLADYAIVAVIALILFLFRVAIRENAGRLWAILRTINDWISLVLVGAAIIAFGMTLQSTSWAPYAWLAGLFSFFVASLFIKSTWATSRNLLRR